jgi:hypothetical protein
MIYGSQLLVAGRRNSGFCSFFSCRTGIERVKNGGANKDGEEKCHNIHADTEQEWLPAADGVEFRTFHGFQIKFSKGNGCGTG